jgi:hypothetical protein
MLWHYAAPFKDNEARWKIMKEISLNERSIPEDVSHETLETVCVSHSPPGSRHLTISRQQTQKKGHPQRRWPFLLFI